LTSMMLHSGHDHGFWQELLEGVSANLPGGEKTVDFLSHLLSDTLQIYLMLFVVMFAVFFLQTYVRTEHMKEKLTGLTSVWGYLLAALMGMISPFCSCSIIPVLMGLAAVGVPVSVCLCMLTSASLMNVTALTALFSLTGVKFASIYLVCAAAIVLVSSLILSRMQMNRGLVDYQTAESCCCCHEHHHHDHDHHHHHSCEEGHDHHPHGQEQHRVRSALCSTAEVFRSAWLWILLGVALAAALETYFPLETLSELISGKTIISLLIAFAVGLPIHSDIFSVYPILQILREVSTPISLSFALSAMVTSVPGVVLLSRVLKPKAIAQYVGVLAALTLGCGLILVLVL
jgi:uncharacterized membrane protein YraQ (UPF0718 family)